jgi:meso-butanediol dehydrogenase / (S,S)-butanediol dehydrogenase / diacetyl reductase
MRLIGKRVLITGTAGGQGEAAQALFAREGARVVGCDIQAGAAEATAAVLRDEGLDAVGFDVDLTDPDAAAAWVEGAAEHLGGIDVLYNNAAGYGFAPFAEMELALWRRVIGVELDIIFHTTRPAWSHLEASGHASVINTASVSGLQGTTVMGAAAHAAAKGGVIAMTRQLAAEGGRHNIRVNAIAPGFIASPASDDAVDPQVRAEILAPLMLKRAGQPADVAALALFLAGDESSWVTGQILSVDGGATAGSAREDGGNRS